MRCTMTTRTFAIPCARPKASAAARTGTQGLTMTKRFWAELKSSEFSGLDPNSTLAILPVASIEQHGPHLPVMTDTAIAEGMLATVLARLPADLHVLVMPI